jgi:hypothetical protein
MKLKFHRKTREILLWISFLRGLCHEDCSDVSHVSVACKRLETREKLLLLFQRCNNFERVNSNIRSTTRKFTTFSFHFSTDSFQDQTPIGVFFVCYFHFPTHKNTHFLVLKRRNQRVEWRVYLRFREWSKYLKFFQKSQINFKLDRTKFIILSKREWKIACN